MTAMWVEITTDHPILGEQLLEEIRGRLGVWGGMSHTLPEATTSACSFEFDPVRLPELIVMLNALGIPNYKIQFAHWSEEEVAATREP